MARELAALNLPVNTAHRVRFLPPLGNPDKNAAYVAGLDLELAVFNVDPETGDAYGDALGSDITVKVQNSAGWRNAYTVKWSLPSTMANPDATASLRVEIRVPGAGNAAVCDSSSTDCLGYLDVYAFENGQDRAQAPTGFAPIPAQGAFPFAFLVLATGNPAPTSLADLDTLTGEEFDVTAGSCASSDFSRPGQGLQAVGAGLQAVGAGLQAVGAVGGLFRSVTSDFDGRITKPADMATALAAKLAGGPGKDVVMMVVDDFGTGIYEVPTAVLEADRGLQDIVDDGSLTHGALVLTQLLAMAPSMTGTESLGAGLNAYTGDPYYVFGEADFEAEGEARNFKLYIQVVNAAGLNTDGMASRISAALDDETINPHGGATVVVNMSFAIVPCAVLGDYSTAALDSFEDYVDALAAVNDVGDDYLDDLGKLVSTPVDLGADPLLAYLECPFPSAAGTRCDGGDSYGHGRKVWWMTHVAASGNYGNTYALYPAASRMVISVGANEVADGGFASAFYSNAAEVVAPGGFYEFGTEGGYTVAYAGTSFAAPLVSLFLAVDLMHYPNYHCAPSDLTVNPGVPPALADGDYAMRPFADVFTDGGTNAFDLHCSVTD